MNNHEHINRAIPPTGENTDTSPEDYERDSQERPRIWIASLADYNNGRLHGDWIDANQDPDDIQQAAWRILASSPEPGAEEWAIHDYDGFGPLRLGEYESFEDVSAIARGIAEHGPAFAAWVDIVWDGGGPLEHELLAEFNDYYMGHYESAESWAEEMWDDLGYTLEARGRLPDSLQSYIRVDYDAFANDMRMGGELSFAEAPDGGVWVFRSM